MFGVNQTRMNITITEIPTTPLKKITLKNDFLKVVLLNYGARMYQIFAPDKNQNFENVLLSHDSYEDLLNDQSFFGATVGPVAGRIRNGKWANVTLEKNNGNHHIHGGSNGWSFQFWDFYTFEEEGSIGVSFYLVDSKSDYPGPIFSSVTYKLTKNELELTITGKSLQESLFNPTNHAYFNLSGNGKYDILSHRLSLHCQDMLELDGANLPTGKLIPSEQLNFNTDDFSIAEMLTVKPAGLDDVFRFRPKTNDEPQLTLTDKTSGRKMTLRTTNQSVVLFSTTGFEAPFFVNGKKMHSNYGLAIEPQECPDIVHFPEWGTILLPANEEKYTRSVYQFHLIEM